MRTPRRNQQGFTLIEIAIVLVIIGLLLGGVLKGQELITSARVRNLISQQDGIKAAFFGFQDRFRAIPGDYANATANITGVTQNGSGDGQIRRAGAGTANDEHILMWEHLSRAGFINGSYTYAAWPPTPQSAPQNPYSMYLVLIYDDNFATGGNPAVGGTLKHNLKTGNQIPADIIAEVDRKVDDGLAHNGAFRWSDHNPAAGSLTVGTAPAAANCYTTAVGATQGQWTVVGNVETNCAATSLF